MRKCLCILHADVLAAAEAIQAYLEGYKLTGKGEYLARAKSGFPFIYFWNAPEQSIMRYGSVPVLGATWYTWP